MDERSWNMPDYCLFMPVLCMSNLPWPQQIVLSGIRSHLVGSAPLQDSRSKGPVAPLIARCEISKFLSVGLLEGESVDTKLTP